MSAEIKALRKQIDADVVEFARELYEKAKSGEITGVLILTQNENRWVTYSHAGLKDRMTLLGFLSHATHKLQTDQS